MLTLFLFLGFFLGLLLAVSAFLGGIWYQIRKTGAGSLLEDHVVHHESKAMRDPIIMQPEELEHLANVAESLGVVVGAGSSLDTNE